MTHGPGSQFLRAAALSGAAALLSACLGNAPDVKTSSVMDNFKKARQERLVADRNYKVGERYRIQTGQVMIRNKLYTVVPESTGAYRSELAIALVGDGQRLDIPAGLAFKTADRQLVNGKLANLVPLPQPLQGAPDVSALFVNDDGTFAPAVMRAGRVAGFAKFDVQPDKAQLTPDVVESVKTSAGYVNYEVVYNSTGVFSYVNCAAPRAPGAKPPPPALTPPPEGSCGSGPHLDLTVVEYDRLQLDRASSANRAWYPVRAGMLDLPGLKVRIHEVTPVHVVYEVTKDDNAYITKSF
jgi:hypothetical protein